MRKLTILIVIIATLISSCKVEKYDDRIKLSSREIFEDDVQAAQVHVDFLASQYIDIEYDGDKAYKLDVELWKHGELLTCIDKVSDIKLKDYSGISIEIDEYKSDTHDVEMGFYSDESHSAIDFTIAVNESGLNGRLESTLSNEMIVNHEDEIYLWGFHKFDNGFEMFEDTKEALEMFEWSMVFVLRPE